MDDGAELDPIYLRLRELREDVEDAEMQRGRPFMRVRRLVATDQALDDARSRLQDTVRDARRAGMDWETIGQALEMTADEAAEKFRQFDY